MPDVNHKRRQARAGRGIFRALPCRLTLARDPGGLWGFLATYLDPDAGRPVLTNVLFPSKTQASKALYRRLYARPDPGD